MIRRMLMQRAVERTDAKLQEAIVAHARMCADVMYYKSISSFYLDRYTDIDPYTNATNAHAFATAMQKREENERDADHCVTRSEELWARVDALKAKLNELTGAN